MGLFAACLCGRTQQRKQQGEKKSWRVFSLNELHAATKNFNYDNKVGEGGFGSVYWGLLWDGSQIAVKRLKAWSSRAEMEFAVEIEILGRVRHKNLLSLRGYCMEGQERLIVYDYMPNMSLVDHLHGEYASENLLDWNRRMNIAIGTAEGLEYLHHYATPHIIHRDVKASNVLLNSDFQPQVADFGFARLIPDGATHVTTRVKGTLGYLAPEYAMWGKASESCDVYSFAVLLLELISGKKPIEKVAPGAKRTIVEWAAPLVFQGKLAEMVDPRLQGKFNTDELKRVIHVATMCAQNAPESRPTMQEVVQLLKGEAKKDKEGEGPEELKLDPVKYDDDLLAADDTETKTPSKSKKPKKRVAAHQAAK